MKNFRKLSALVVLLAALSAPALAGDLETPPAPQPTPAAAPAPTQPAPGDLETPPVAVAVAETMLGVVLTVVGLI